MVNACLLYGIELTLEDFKSLIPPKNDDIKEWLDECDDDDHETSDGDVTNEANDSEDKYDQEEIDNYHKLCNLYEAYAEEDYFYACELVNEHFSLTSLCEFRLNSACCCKNNNNKEIFLGWTSEGAWSNGLFSKKINMLSRTEESKVDSIILTYFPEETTQYYVAARDCDYCT